MQSIEKKGFTLIELLIMMAIVITIAIGVQSINFKSISDTQKRDSFVYNIVRSYEWVRNNALTGQWIWTDLNVPDAWQFNISTNHFSTQYMSWWTLYTYNEIPTSLQDGEEIESISCIWVNTDDLNISGTGSIFITSQNMNLGGDCNSDTHNTLEIVAGYNGFTKTITINTLSGLAEVQ